jgi:hypothetical protein
MSVFSEIEDTIGNVSITENGAKGHATTKHALLDMNFKVTSYRNDKSTLIDDFKKAYNEDPQLALKWLFYARDCRGGLGERDLFIEIFNHLCENVYGASEKLIPLIPEYGRFKDLRFIKAKTEIFKFFKYQLFTDIQNAKEDRLFSLLAKWLPSENATSQETKMLAREFIGFLKMTPKQYRKILSDLRKKLDVVEVKMSAGEFDKINYRSVPSKANLLYKDAFLKHDKERREEYLNKVASGEETINASVLFPHDIVHKYTRLGWGAEVDNTIEVLWKALPSALSFENTMVVADGSGSMQRHVGNTSVSALDVANALAIYFSERNTGEYKNKYITFSTTPQFVDFSSDTTLFQKLERAKRHSEIADTNIEAVFDLILRVAKTKNVSQFDMPKNILIISDMEFNKATENPYDERLFDIIKAKYDAAGFKLPKLIFWNVNGRSSTIPVKENELGVALVSGFSTATIRMAMTSELDPYLALKKVLLSDRYEAVNI